jgi:hypothetical protein
MIRRDYSNSLAPVAAYFALAISKHVSIKKVLNVIKRISCFYIVNTNTLYYDQSHLILGVSIRLHCLKGYRENQVKCKRVINSYIGKRPGISIITFQLKSGFTNSKNAGNKRDRTIM